MYIIIIDTPIGLMFYDNKSQTITNNFGDATCFENIDAANDSLKNINIQYNKKIIPIFVMDNN